MGDSVRAEVLALTDDQLLEKLVEMGQEDAGPIMDSTRTAYQSMLIRKMKGEVYERVEVATDSEEDDEADDEDNDYEEEDDDMEFDDDAVEEIDSGLRYRNLERDDDDMSSDPPTAVRGEQRRPNIFITFIKMVMLGVFLVTLLILVTSKQ